MNQETDRISIQLLEEVAMTDFVVDKSKLSPSGRALEERRERVAYLIELLNQNGNVFDDTVKNLFLERFPDIQGFGPILARVHKAGVQYTKGRVSPRRRANSQETEQIDLNNAGQIIQALKGFQIQVLSLKKQNISLQIERDTLKKEFDELKLKYDDIMKFMGTGPKGGKRFKHLVAEGLRGLELPGARMIDPESDE